MLSTLLDPTGAAVVAKAITNFNAYVDDFVPKQLQFRALLDGLGVPTDLFAALEAFHGELYHLTKVCSGVTLVTNAGFLCTKWSDPSKMGNSILAFLKAAALDLYSITIP